MPAKFLMPVAKSSKKDPQQYRLYRMERECFDGICRAQLTLPQIKTFAKAVCRNYGVPGVTFRLKDIGHWTGMCWTDGNIDLNRKKRKSRTIITVAHELAHHVHNWLVPHLIAKQQNHGPEFLACYMSILDTSRIVPMQGMRAILQSYDLQYIDPGDNCSLSTLKRRISKEPE